MKNIKFERLTFSLFRKLYYNAKNNEDPYKKVNFYLSIGSENPNETIALPATEENRKKVFNCAFVSSGELVVCDASHYHVSSKQKPICDPGVFKNDKDMSSGFGYESQTKYDRVLQKISGPYFKHKESNLLYYLPGRICIENECRVGEIQICQRPLNALSTNCVNTGMWIEKK